MVKFQWDDIITRNSLLFFYSNSKTLVKWLLIMSFDGFLFQYNVDSQFNRKYGEWCWSVTTCVREQWIYRTEICSEANVNVRIWFLTFFFLFWRKCQLLYLKIVLTMMNLFFCFLYDVDDECETDTQRRFDATNYIKMSQTVLDRIRLAPL